VKSPRQIAFSRDSSWIAAGNSAGEVVLWRPTYFRRGSIPEDLAPVWRDLATEDSTVAYRAIWSFATVPDMAVAFLKNRLTPQKTAGGKASPRTSREVWGRFL